MVREAERLYRSSDWNPSVSLARLCDARGSDFAQVIANKQNTTGYLGQAARPPGQGPANACALKLTRMGVCRTTAGSSAVCLRVSLCPFAVAIPSRLLAIGYWLLAIGYWLFAQHPKQNPVGYGE
jgi:hypothetical protein